MDNLIDALCEKASIKSKRGFIVSIIRKIFFKINQPVYELLADRISEQERQIACLLEQITEQQDVGDANTAELCALKRKFGLLEE